MTDAFDWTEQENVTVRTQMAIAVYLNPFGELVIRQEGQFHPDEDHWVVIAPDNVAKVLAAMHEVMGIAVPAGMTKDPTAANRPRRHRDGEAPVTVPDDTVPDRDAAGPDRDKLPLLAAAE